VRHNRGHIWGHNGYDSKSIVRDDDAFEENKENEKKAPGIMKNFGVGGAREMDLGFGCAV